MESTTSSRTKAASLANRKTTAMGRQLIGAPQRSARTTAQSAGSGTAQISKVIKKAYVRFDDYLDLNEENMRRSCKRLMNRLYKEEASASDSPATASLHHDDDKQNDQPKRTGAPTDNVSLTLSTASSVGGRSYLRSQFERRQQRQMAAMLKSARQAKQASDESLQEIQIKQQQQVAKETGKVSAGANRCADSCGPSVSNADPVQVVAGRRVDNAMVPSAATAAAAEADAYRRQQMVQRQMQQQDSVARSHELSKRRFFEQLERRKSAAAVAAIAANATRNTCAPNRMQGNRGHASEQHCLGHSISTDATNSTEDQKPIVAAAATSRGNRSSNNDRQVFAATHRTTGNHQSGPQEYCCGPVDGNASDGESACSTQLLLQQVDGGELDKIGNSKQLIAWTQNLSATTNETTIGKGKIANGTTEYEQDNKRANVFVVASRDDDLSGALAADDSSSWPNNGDEVQVAAAVVERNHQPQEIIIGNYVNGSIISDALISDGANPCEQLGTQPPITIDACDPSRFKQQVMAVDEKLMNASNVDAAAPADDDLAVERLAFDYNEQSMFEIKVPAAGECAGSNPLGGACDGHISELIVKQVVEVDGSDSDQVSSNSVGICEKEKISNGSGVQSGSSWQTRHREANQERENHLQQPPTSIGRQDQSEAPKDACSKSETGESAMSSAQPIEAVRAAETASREQAIVLKKTPMVGRADDCINKGNSNNNNNTNNNAEDAGNNKCSVEISNHKFRAINGISSGGGGGDGVLLTIESDAIAQNDNQRSNCNSEPAFDLVAAPTISTYNSSAAVNDNQGRGGKRQCPTRATMTDIYDGDDTVTGTADRAPTDLRSYGQVDTGASSTVVGPDQIPIEDSLTGKVTAAATTSALSCGSIVPETDVAITTGKDKAIDDEGPLLLGGGDSVNMNGPDKVSGAAVQRSDGEQVSGQLLAMVRSYGCSADEDRDKVECNATCSAMMQSPQKKITHDPAPRDVPLGAVSPEAVANTCSSGGGGGKINRLLVRNDDVDVVVKSGQQHETTHDYERHDGDDGDPDCPRADYDCELSNGKQQQQLREQVNERKEQEDEKEADVDERLRSKQQHLAGTNGGNTALVSHDQSQWAKPDSSGGTRGIGIGSKCFLNDANRLIGSFQMAPAYQQVKSFTCLPAAAMGPTTTVSSNQSCDEAGAISPGECNGTRNARTLQQLPGAEPEPEDESGNVASSNNNDANYCSAKHSEKLCNDTCGGTGGDKEENSKDDAPESNEDHGDRSTYGCGPIELLICADSEKPPTQHCTGQVQSSSSSSQSSSMSMSSSPAVSSTLIALSGTARAGATNVAGPDEDGCCGSSSCSSSGFGASVASTDDSAPQPSQSAAGTCGGSDSAPKSSSLAPISFPATAPPAGSAQIYQSARRRRFVQPGESHNNSQQQHHSHQLTVAPLYDCLRLKQQSKLISGGGPCASDGPVTSKRSGPTSLFDEFPDYKQISVGPDEAYPKRSGRPPVVVENYGYASVGQQQRPTSISATCMIGDGGRREQVNSSTTTTTMVKEHSYANIPSATEQCSWNSMVMLQRRASTAATATGMNNNGYAIVRNGITRNTLDAGGSHMSFGPSNSCGESSVASAASERPSAAGTQQHTSSSGESANESSSQSAGFSALPPVRLVDCTSANIFESLPPVLNSNSNNTHRGMTNSAGCRNVNNQQKTKASLLKRFGSLVSRAFANGNNNNNNIHTDDSMVECSESPLSLPPASSLKTVGTRSGEQHQHQSDHTESKVESITGIGSNSTTAAASKHMKDADLVILPPKSQTAPKVTKASHEQLSPRARQRASAADRYHRKSLRQIISRRVGRQRTSRHYQDDEQYSTSVSSSSLCNSSESLYSSANAYHRHLSRKRESSEFGSMDANLIAKQASNSYRKRASSLSEELESLMSRSAADSDEQRQLLLAGKSPNNKLDRKSSTRTHSKQLNGTSGTGNAYGIVDRNKSMSVHRQQHRFDIDCERQRVLQQHNHQQCMGVDGVNTSTNKNKNTNVAKNCSLQVLRWIGNEPKSSGGSSQTTGVTCAIGAPLTPRVESTPNLGKEASVKSGIGASDSGSSSSSSPPEERDNQFNRAIDNVPKHYSRGSKLLAVARKTIDANFDHHHDHDQQAQVEGFLSLIEQSHAASSSKSSSNNAKLGRSDRQEQQKSQTEVSKRATCAKRRAFKQEHRQPTSLIYSNLLQTAVKKSAAGTAARHSLRSDENDDNDFDSEQESECDCSGERSSHHCKLCVASSNQENDENENDSGSNKCDSPSLYQILLRNYVKRRHTTAKSQAKLASAADKTDSCDARKYLSHRRHHLHESHHRTIGGASRAHRHSHRHRRRSHHRHRHHHHHHSHHSYGHRHCHSPIDSESRRLCTSPRPLIGQSLISSRGELLDTNELRIRGTGSATSARTPTTTTTSGAESGTDCYGSRRMHLCAGAEKQTATAKQRNKIMTGSCCSDNVIAGGEHGESRQAHVWGQLIKINRSDGSQVVELQRAPGKHWGFFVARGAINNVKGIFISRMHDSHDSHSVSSLVGLLSIGDRIIAIDDSPIEPDHDIMRVNQMISKKSKILLKVKPLKG